MAMKPHRMKDKVFGLLTVKARLPNTRQNASLWFCDCECGGTRITTGGNLKSGKVSSCGCLVGSNQYKRKE